MRKIVLVSHNLNLEGAPLFLLDLARHHVEKGAQLTVVSASDGILRSSFAALGARITIMDPGAVFAALSEVEARAAIATLGLNMDIAECDLVICNTFTTFWAVHAALASHRPVLYYVHESTTPAAFYRDSLSPAVLGLLEAALVEANCVSFTSAGTRRYHDRPNRPIRAVITPGWVEVAKLDAWRKMHPRASLRRSFGLKDGELLVTNVGTICDRKGQHEFVRAIDLMRRRYPDLAARTRFVLLGGRNSPFDDMLRDLLDELRLPNLAIHPENPDYLPYYVAADLCVCTSYEESSPRVVLESMACGTPLLGSDITGINELARHGIEASLVPAGNTIAWAEALARMLLAPGIGRDLAARARARVLDRFDSALLLPQHWRLAGIVAADRR